MKYYNSLHEVYDSKKQYIFCTLPDVPLTLTVWSEINASM